jgi:hypothetical protein
MDAWETLLSGSTIDSGDAWEHLQVQGGGGGDPVYIPVEAYRDLDYLSAASVDHEHTTHTADVIDTLSAAIEAEQHTAETTTENTLDVVCLPLHITSTYLVDGNAVFLTDGTNYLISDEVTV